LTRASKAWNSVILLLVDFEKVSLTGLDSGRSR